MTSALATGRAALVTLPRMFKKVGRASGRAVPAVARMADANAKARSRRIAPLLPQPRVYGAAGCEVKHLTRRAASSEWRAGYPRYTFAVRTVPLLPFAPQHKMIESTYRTLTPWH